MWTKNEVADFSDTSDDNEEITNKRCEMFHNNSDEGKINIFNEINDMLHTNSDEGSTTTADERHDGLQNKSYEEITSMTQDFEEVKQIEMNNNSATNDRNSGDFFEKKLITRIATQYKISSCCVSKRKWKGE